MRTIWVVAGLTLVAACARVMPPPGGNRDQEPPRVVETFPAQNANVPNLAGTNQEVRIIFHETLSERSPRDMVQVSPESGEVRAERDGEEIRVTIEGGWKPNRVYRVTVLPGIVDRLGNARTTAFDLVFSTGATIEANAFGGVATDLITGRPVIGARVEAVARTDSTVYTAVTDTSGFFGLRSLPPGLYDSRIYSDQNRNRKLDANEARATREINIGATDTLAVELTLLAPDTTPARLLKAEIRDSLQVRLTFDDYFDPNGPVPPVAVTAWLLPDSSLMAGGTVMTPRAFQRTRADTATATVPGVAAVPPRAATDTTRQLPINELVWVPGTPLRHSARYRISATGYRNLQGVGNGGGSVVVTSPAPPRAAPPPAARDSIRR
jgi:hypothetical protein